jgi:rod shape-determining protein MreD
LLLALTAALLLSIVPLPDGLEWFRPYWVALVVIYWVLEEQQSIGLGTAFVVGIVLDILAATLLGLHALSLVVLVYLVRRFRSRLRFFPPWQQAMAVLALLLNDRIILLWIATLLGEPLPTWHYWLGPLIGTVVWPWLFLFLDRARIGSRQRKV